MDGQVPSNLPLNINVKMRLLGIKLYLSDSASETGQS